MGVTGVANQTVVKPKVDMMTISDDIQHALHRTWSSDNIKVSATGGKVHLTGKVDTWRDRELQQPLPGQRLERRASATISASADLCMAPVGEEFPTGGRVPSAVVRKISIRLQRV